MKPPQLIFFATFSVQVAPTSEHIEVGYTLDGHRRVVPITGGTVTGPDISGRILNGGSDFQVTRAPDLVYVEAKYVVETANGRIYVDNRGVRTGRPEDIEDITRGRPVDPSRLSFRCTPRLQGSSPAWSWLDRSLFVGAAERHPDRVEIDVYRLI